MSEEYEKEKKLYDSIFWRMQQLFGDRVAIGTCWGYDKDGKPVNTPYDPRIKMYTVHAAATISSIHTLTELAQAGIITKKDYWVHRCTIMAERFFLEQQAILGNDSDKPKDDERANET